MPKFIELIIVESDEDEKSETNRGRALISKYNDFNQIPMIKIIRELTGCQLVEAKNIVCNMQDNFRSFNRSNGQRRADITDSIWKMETDDLIRVFNFVDKINKGHHDLV